MPKLQSLAFAGLITAFSGAYLASAQTSSVALLAIQSGNGQVACDTSGTLVGFTNDPLVVKATDSKGNPVAGATVTWSITSVTNGNLTLATATTTTGADGTSTNQINWVIFNYFTSTAVPYLVANIQATANNNSVTFTETQSLITDQGSCVIAANGPTYQGSSLTGVTLSANAGTTQTTNPIQIQVAGLNQASNGVANVAIRLINAQASPTLSCAYNGGYADPGSVLSDSQGNAKCFPVFTGSGSGQYYVTVGGLPSSSFSSALYLNAFGPFNFTSIPGTPTAFQIVSGNNQVGSPGQTLNPLVAKLVDGTGNAVQGQTVTWTVVPAGAVSLPLGSTTFVTDGSGLVTTAGSLNSLAAAGAQVTVALASNPSISATFQLTLAGAITALTKVSGDNQSAQLSTTFAQPLVVQVNNATGPVKNYPVQFQTNGPVILPNGSTVGTDGNGQATIAVKAGTVTGTATVTAVVGILNQTFNLTITPTSTTPPPTSLAIVGGNNQTAVLSTPFATPLTVQVNGASGPIAGYTVNFSTTGPVSLGTATATTNSSGQAQVTVSAGAATGPATVTASVTGFSQTFNLTVVPVGPNVTANSFLNAASRQVGAISPCALATISAAGLTPDGISDLSPAPIFGRLPLAVHNISVTFGGITAPILNVAMGATNPEVTLQVPCEVTPAASVPVVVNVGAGSANANVAVQTVSPGIFQTVMSDGTSRAVVVRDDGTFADIGGTFSNPARVGERVRIYATGLGATVPAVGTNAIQDPNADLFGTNATVSGTVNVQISGVGAQVISARVAPDLIGVYEVQFLIPSTAQTGSNVVISVGVIPVGANSGAAPVQSPNSTIPIQ